MSYGSANDDERLLTYASSKQPATTSSSSTPLPSSTNPSARGSTTHAAIHPSSSLPSGSTTIPSPGAGNHVALNSMPSSNHNLPHTMPTLSSVTSSAAAERVTSYARQVWTDCRPWAEFYSTHAINFPQFHALSDRVSTNMHLYRANYQVLAAFWLALFILTAIPSFVIAIAAFFLLDRSAARLAARNNGKLPHRDMVILSLIALAVVWITGIAQHVLISLALSSIFIVAHAALHEPSTIETEIANV